MADGNIKLYGKLKSVTEEGKVADYSEIDGVPIIMQDLSASGFTPTANTYYLHTGETAIAYDNGMIYFYNGTNYTSIIGGGDLNLENGTGVDNITLKYSGEVDETHGPNIIDESAESNAVFGELNKVKNNRNLITGKMNTVNASNAIVGGFNNIVSGNHAIVGGQNNTVNEYAFVFGGNNNNSGRYSAAIGGDNTVKSNYCLVSGKNNNITHSGVIALGEGLKSLNDSQVLVGKYNFADSSNIFEIGWGTSDNDRKNVFSIDKSNNVKVSDNLIIGANTIDNASNGLISGKENIVSGSTVMAVGKSNVVSHNRSSAIGYWNKTGAEYQTVIGRFNKGKNNTVFEVGYGSGVEDNQRRNAFEVLRDGRAKVQSAPVDNDDVVRKQELDTKLDSSEKSNLVDLISAQTISGSKTFTSSVKMQNGFFALGSPAILGAGIRGKGGTPVINIPTSQSGTTYMALAPSTAPTTDSIIVNSSTRAPTWKPLSELVSESGLVKYESVTIPWANVTTNGFTDTVRVVNQGINEHSLYIRLAYNDWRAEVFLTVISTESNSVTSLDTLLGVTYYHEASGTIHKEADESNFYLGQIQNVSHNGVKVLIPVITL